MSRYILTSKKPPSAEETALRNTEDGKLVFTTYKGLPCGMLLGGKRLLAMQVFPEENSMVGSIYIAKVKNVTANLDACFLELTKGEVAFLPLKEASDPFLLNRTYDGRLLQGDELLVQVTRDAQKTKGMSVTARVNLVNDAFSMTLGESYVKYSSKLSDAVKKDLENTLNECGILHDGAYDFVRAVSDREDLPQEFALKSLNFGMIVRTQAASLDRDALVSAYKALEEEFYTLLKISLHKTPFTCLKAPDKPWVHCMKTMVRDNEYAEIVTDDPALYEEIVSGAAEGVVNKPVRLYEQNDLSLSDLYSLESKADTAFNARIWLKSGAYLIIEYTEALTVIDVNSGKYEARKASDKYAQAVNLEAAEEIMLQLRLRNLSGIIIVDFISVKDKAMNAELMQSLKDLAAADITRTSIVDMTPLGLVEITRKKTGKPLREQLGRK